eukprot:5126270-Pyramimonas_sp.AAC.1
MSGAKLKGVGGNAPRKRGAGVQARDIQQMLTQIMYIYAFGPYRFPQRHVTGDDCEDTASETAAEWRRIVAERRPWTDPAFPPQKESIDGPE